MIATHSGWYLHVSCSHTRLQIHYIHKIEINELLYIYTQLVPSKLVTACNTRIQYSRCSLTINATPTIIAPEAKEVSEQERKACGDSFEAITDQS